MTRTPHADFYTIKGLIASSHPELLELLTEAVRRYCLYEAASKAKPPILFIAPQADRGL